MQACPIVLQRYHGILQYGASVLQNKAVVFQYECGVFVRRAAVIEDNLTREKEPTAMQTDFLPRPDGAFREWGENFLNVATQSGAGLPLTPAQRAELQNLLNGFAAAMNAHETAKAHFHSMTEGKDAARDQFDAAVRKVARVIQSDAEVPDALKVGLGLKPHTGVRSRGAPVTPTDLRVQADANGDHRLAWNRLTNKPNTNFMIEAQIGDDPAWRLIGAANAARFTHTGQSPGVRIAYRVAAHRAGRASVPSAAAVLYDNARVVLK